MPFRSPILALSLILPLVAHAQTAAINETDLSRGATLPPSSAATVDEATAPLVNPAGLKGVGGAELNYIHERSISRGQTVDGIYLGDTFFDAVALGLSLEWMRGSVLPDYRKTTWTLALGGPTLSVGSSLNLFNSSANQQLNHLTSWNVGLTLRPLRAVSLGASILNLDEPSRGAVMLPRKFDFGLGLRPFHERLTVGFDYLFSSQDSADKGTAQVMAQGELLRGVVLGAGVSRSFAASHDVLFQLSLTLNSPHLGATYAAGFAPGGTDHVIVLRASQKRTPGIELGAGKVALLDLGHELSSSNGPLALLGGPEEDPYLTLTRKLERAGRDPDLKGLILKINSLPTLGLGKSMELRNTVLALRRSGKRVIALLLNAGDTEYFLATAADTVVTVPQALLLINGFDAELSFLGGSMEKLGVHWDVARVGQYKNAPDQLTRSSPSKEQLEATNALLDTGVGVYESAVAEARHLSVSQFHVALADGILSPARAKALGLVDEVMSPRDLEERIPKLVPGARYDADYAAPNPAPRAWGERRRIALIPVLGDISGGKSREDPLGVARIAGAETIVRALRRAEEDDSVVAVVLRIDSPGGDGLASDLIYRAVLSAKMKKPVIASMGDVAASGGYYAAMGADEIFALPTTITGSIGVFVVKPAFEALANKLGFHQQGLLRAPLADIFNLYRPWTAREQKAAQVWVDAFYDDFITEVAARRSLGKAQVDAVARGRVWSGADAKARGLIDAFGGVEDAIAEARKRAHVSSSEELELPVYGEPTGLFASVAGEDGVLSHLHLTAPQNPLSDGVRALALELGVPPLCLIEPGVKARLPFDIRIQ